MIVGAPPATGCKRSARAPLTLNSSGLLSVVPRKCAPGVVLALPVIFHALLRTPEETCPLVN